MEIDRKTLKALAADTRLDILKSLGRRRKMPSELSKELDLAASTVTEHLDRLEEAGLVRREETGHKWIYYSLTEKGESLIKPRIPVQFVIVLSISIIVIAAGFVYVNYNSNYSALTPSEYGGQIGGSQAPVGQESGSCQTCKATTTGSASIANISEQLALELANIAIQPKCNVTYTQIEKLPWNKEDPSWNFFTSNCPDIEKYNYSEIWRTSVFLNKSCSLPYCIEIITLVGTHGEFSCSYGLHRDAAPGLDKLENIC